MHNNYIEAVVGNEILVLRVPPTMLVQNVCKESKKENLRHKI